MHVCWSPPRSMQTGAAVRIRALPASSWLQYAPARYDIGMHKPAKEWLSGYTDTTDEKHMPRTRSLHQPRGCGYILLPQSSAFRPTAMPPRGFAPVTTASSGRSAATGTPAARRCGRAACPFHPLRRPTAARHEARRGQLAEVLETWEMSGMAKTVSRHRGVTPGLNGVSGMLCL